MVAVAGAEGRQQWCVQVIIRKRGAKEVITKLEHDGDVETLAWSHDDQILAAGGSDNQVMCTAE